jgi:hypothetical protein
MFALTCFRDLLGGQASIVIESYLLYQYISSIFNSGIVNFPSIRPYSLHHAIECFMFARPGSSIQVGFERTWGRETDQIYMYTVRFPTYRTSYPFRAPNRPASSARSMSSFDFASNPD